MEINQCQTITVGHLFNIFQCNMYGKKKQLPSLPKIFLKRTLTNSCLCGFILMREKLCFYLGGDFAGIFTRISG